MSEQTQVVETEVVEEQSDETTAIAVVKDEPIKIPDRIMFEALEGFVMGKTRAQIADELLDNLPEDLDRLQAMDRKAAKALLCSRLRQADPNSTKFASKYKSRYIQTLKTLRDALQSRMRTMLSVRIDTMISTEQTLDQTAEKLKTYLAGVTPDTISTKEVQGAIKTLISVCKMQNENTRVLTAFVESFDSAYDYYEKYSRGYYR